MHFKKTAALLLSIVILLCFGITAFAASPTLTVDSVTAGKGDEVDVSISISNNTGFAAMTLSIGYDKEALTYKSFEKGILSDYTVKDHPSSGIIRLVNVENGNLTENGKLITLKFKVSKDAGDGLHPVTIHLKSGDICDWDLNNLTPEIVSGGVTVSASRNSSPESFVSGSTSSNIKSESNFVSKDTESSNTEKGSAEKLIKSEKHENQKKQKNNFITAFLILLGVLLLLAVIIFILKNKIFRREKV